MSHVRLCSRAFVKSTEEVKQQAKLTFRTQRDRNTLSHTRMRSPHFLLIRPPSANLLAQHHSVAALKHIDAPMTTTVVAEVGKHNSPPKNANHITHTSTHLPNCTHRDTRQRALVAKNSKIHDTIA